MKQEKTRILTRDGVEVEAFAPAILSVSRATDIPAFYAEWFFNRLEEGYCKWRNPFNRVVNYVSFERVRFIVFWSKNPAPLIPYLDRLKKRGIGCYIQYTLNDYEAEGLEPGVPATGQRVETFRRLVEVLSTHGVVWRFDPMILTDKIGISELLQKVSFLAEQLQGYTDTLIFSFADIAGYRKVGRNLAANGIGYEEWTEVGMREFALRLSQLNKESRWNLKLRTCAERIDLSEFGIEHSRCVDDERIARIANRDACLMTELGLRIHEQSPGLFGEIEMLPAGAIFMPEGRYAMCIANRKDSGQRQLCGCIKSKDIGQYDTCPHGCLYCYANTSSESASRNYHRHNPDTETIIS